jgi:hypothetical protein
MHFPGEWILWILFFWGMSALFWGGGRRRHRSRRRRRFEDWLAQQPAAAAPPPAPAQPAPPPKPLPEPDPVTRLPFDVQLKVQQIRSKIEALMKHASEFPFASRDLFVLQRTRTDYLPATLDAYLALPPEFAEIKVAPDGRTALQVLKDQLGLLDGKLDEIAEDLQRQNVDRLLANERFLADHFGRQPAELSIPRSS